MRASKQNLCSKVGIDLWSSNPACSAPKNVFKPLNDVLCATRSGKLYVRTSILILISSTYLNYISIGRAFDVFQLHACFGLDSPNGPQPSRGERVVSDGRRLQPLPHTSSAPTADRLDPGLAQDQSHLFAAVYRIRVGELFWYFRKLHLFETNFNSGNRSDWRRQNWPNCLYANDSYEIVSVYLIVFPYNVLIYYSLIIILSCFITCSKLLLKSYSQS